MKKNNRLSLILSSILTMGFIIIPLTGGTCAGDPSSEKEPEESSTITAPSLVQKLQAAKKAELKKIVDDFFTNITDKDAQKAELKKLGKDDQNVFHVLLSHGELDLAKKLYEIDKTDQEIKDLVTTKQDKNKKLPIDLFAANSANITNTALLDKLSELDFDIKTLKLSNGDTIAHAIARISGDADSKADALVHVLKLKNFMAEAGNNSETLSSILVANMGANTYGKLAAAQSDLNDGTNSMATLRDDLGTSIQALPGFTEASNILADRTTTPASPVYKKTGSSNVDINANNSKFEPLIALTNDASSLTGANDKIISDFLNLRASSPDPMADFVAIFTVVGAGDANIALLNTAKTNVQTAVDEVTTARKTVTDAQTKIQNTILVEAQEALSGVENPSTAKTGIDAQIKIISDLLANEITTELEKFTTLTTGFSAVVADKKTAIDNINSAQATTQKTAWENARTDARTAATSAKESAAKMATYIQTANEAKTQALQLHANYIATKTQAASQALANAKSILEAAKNTATDAQSKLSAYIATAQGAKVGLDATTHATQISNIGGKITAIQNIKDSIDDILNKFTADDNWEKAVGDSETSFNADGATLAQKVSAAGQAKTAATVAKAAADTIAAELSKAETAKTEAVNIQATVSPIAAAALIAQDANTKIIEVNAKEAASSTELSQISAATNDFKAGVSAGSMLTSIEKQIKIITDNNATLATIKANVETQRVIIDTKTAESKDDSKSHAERKSAADAALTAAKSAETEANKIDSLLQEAETAKTEALRLQAKYKENVAKIAALRKEATDNNIESKATVAQKIIVANTSGGNEFEDFLKKAEEAENNATSASATKYKRVKPFVVIVKDVYKSVSEMHTKAGLALKELKKITNADPDDFQEIILKQAIDKAIKAADEVAAEVTKEKILEFVAKAEKAAEDAVAEKDKIIAEVELEGLQTQAQTALTGAEDALAAAETAQGEIDGFVKEATDAQTAVTGDEYKNEITAIKTADDKDDFGEYLKAATEEQTKINTLVATLNASIVDIKTQKAALDAVTVDTYMTKGNDAARAAWGTAQLKPIQEKSGEVVGKVMTGGKPKDLGQTAAKTAKNAAEALSTLVTDNYAAVKVLADKAKKIDEDFKAESEKVTDALAALPQDIPDDDYDLVDIKTAITAAGGDAGLYEAAVKEAQDQKKIIDALKTVIDNERATIDALAPLIVDENSLPAYDQAAQEALVTNAEAALGKAKQDITDAGDLDTVVTAAQDAMANAGVQLDFIKQDQDKIDAEISTALGKLDKVIKDDDGLQDQMSKIESYASNLNNYFTTNYMDKSGDLVIEVKNPNNKTLVESRINSELKPLMEEARNQANEAKDAFEKAVSAIEELDSRSPKTKSAATAAIAKAETAVNTAEDAINKAEDAKNLFNSKSQNISDMAANADVQVNLGDDIETALSELNNAINAPDNDLEEEQLKTLNKYRSDFILAKLGENIDSDDSLGLDLPKWLKEEVTKFRESLLKFNTTVKSDPVKIEQFGTDGANIDTLHPLITTYLKFFVKDVPSLKIHSDKYGPTYLTLEFAKLRAEIQNLLKNNKFVEAGQYSSNFGLDENGDDSEEEPEYKKKIDSLTKRLTKKGTLGIFFKGKMDDIVSSNKLDSLKLLKTRISWAKGVKKNIDTLLSEIEDIKQKIKATKSLIKKYNSDFAFKQKVNSKEHFIEI